MPIKKERDKNNHQKKILVFVLLLIKKQWGKRKFKKEASEKNKYFSLPFYIVQN